MSSASLLVDTKANAEYTQASFSGSSLSGLEVVTELKYQQQQQAITNSDLSIEVQTSGVTATGSFSDNSFIHTLTLITPTYSSIQSIQTSSSNSAGSLSSSSSPDYKKLKFISVYMALAFGASLLVL